MSKSKCEAWKEATLKAILRDIKVQESKAKEKDAWMDACRKQNEAEIEEARVEEVFRHRMTLLYM